MKKRTKALLVVSAVATLHGTYAYLNQHYVVYAIDGAILLGCLGLAVRNYTQEKNS